MPWFNVGGGVAVEASGFAETQYILAGGHGYATQAEAKAHPASWEDLTKLTAEGIATWNAQSPSQTGQTAIAGGTAAKGAASSIGGGFLQFLDNLTQRALWVRVVKVILGVTMVLVGVGHITGASKALTSVAAKAGLAAAA